MFRISSLTVLSVACLSAVAGVASAADVEVYGRMDTGFSVKMNHD